MSQSTVDVFDVYLRKLDANQASPIARVDVTCGGLELRQVPVWYDQEKHEFRVGALTETNGDKRYIRGRVANRHHADIIGAVRDALAQKQQEATGKPVGDIPF